MFQQLATLEELPIDSIDSWVQTQDYTIPYEYSLFAVDQLLLDDWANDRKTPIPCSRPGRTTPFSRSSKWVPKKFNFGQ